jgi:hypothetical protein
MFCYTGQEWKSNSFLAYLPMILWFLQEMVPVKSVPLKNGKPVADETSDEEESESEEEAKVCF